MAAQIPTRQVKLESIEVEDREVDPSSQGTRRF